MGLRKYPHGLTYTKEYHIWLAMKNRCNSPVSKQFKNYGARGIKVCKEWEENFAVFYEDMGGCPKGYCLDRIDNDKGYFKENCRWVTPAENSRNKRNNRYFVVNGERLCLADIAAKYGLSKATLKARIDLLGWDIERAVSQGLPSKTHCKHGHEMTEENTYTSRRGKSCKVCRREADRRRRPATGANKTAYLKRQRDENGRFS